MRKPLIEVTRMSKHRLVVGFGLVAVTVPYLVEAYNYQGLAGLMPKILGYGMLILSAVMIMQGFGILKYFDKKQSTVTGSRLIIGLAILIASYVYIKSMEYVGFVVSTSVFLFLFMFALGEKKLVRNAVISIIASVLIMLLFTRVMYVPFPQGSMFSRFR